MSRPVGTLKRTRLDSGLRVLSEHHPSVKSVAVGVWVDVGSRHESPELAGLSHLIEHMTFKGTRKRTARQIVAEFESRGGLVNAFTSREQTCYYAKVLDSHLPVAIEVLADIVRHSRYDGSELKREQKVIFEEIKDVHDTPSDWVHDLFAETHWGRKSLGLPVLGRRSTVYRAERDDIVDYRKRHYTPARMVIAACGEVDHGALLRLVRKHFGEWPNGSAESSESHLPGVKGGMKVFSHRSAQAHVVMGFPSLAYGDKRKFCLLVLQQLFGGGMSSRLFQRIREELSLAYSVYSFQDSYRDCGVFGLYLGTDPKTASKAAEASAVELGRLRQGDFNEPEVQSAKEQLKGQLVLGLENTSSRMNRVARQELYLGKQVTLADTLKQIDAVRTEDVAKLAKELVSRKKLTAVAVGPLSPGMLSDVDWSPLD
jgi:predicted Zn-dependent peptidase